MNAETRRILEAACAAPSGENAQPWQFLYREKEGRITIDVYVSDARDNSLYGWGNRASYVAIGAAIENMRIAAVGLALKTRLQLLPKTTDLRYAATIFFEKGDLQAPHPLEQAIFQRSTNRKPYQTQPFQEDEITVLNDIAKDTPGPRLILVTQRSDIRRLAEVGGTNERIMLGNRTLHDFFFHHVNWTAAEDQKKKVGFFIDTLELPPPARVGFRLLRHWNVARFLNTCIQMNKIVAKQNAGIYASCSAVGVIASPGESPKDAIQTGILMQRIWLEATTKGYWMQPMTGVLYFALCLHAGERSGFSEAEAEIILDEEKVVRNIAKLSTREQSYFMFRIGRGAPPTARSIRFSVEQVARQL